MVLNVAPRFDAATEYSYKWNRRLMKELETSCVELLGNNATRAMFEAAIKADPFNLVIFYDHGDKGELIASGGREALLDRSNVGLVGAKEVYTMCCLAAKDLGPEAYRAGARVWWGYTKVFSFMPQHEEIYSRLSNLGLILVRKGGRSWMAAHKEVVTEFTREIENATDPWVEATLINDRDCLVVWCDENVPDTSCPFRAAGVELFGKAGNHISRTFALYVLLYLMGLSGVIYCVSYIVGGQYVPTPTVVWVLTSTALVVAGGVGLIREHLRWLAH